ncbi:hypothetical protein F0562_028886 [Nyssa sinensis]|uniref:K-box domain-containing protein n=1 Tax=Nyssa sinensis TaxID=561372 RepID=A0A5J5B1E0_9ASTE|nr:hypothetical protein F0562_028886 [Nyssa sinensis]
MTFDAKDFTQTSLPRRTNIANANGVILPVTGAGTVTLTPTLQLPNTLLVPSLSHKLLSEELKWMDLDWPSLFEAHVEPMQSVRVPQAPEHQAVSHEVPQAPEHQAVSHEVSHEEENQAVNHDEALVPIPSKKAGDVLILLHVEIGLNDLESEHKEPTSEDPHKFQNPDTKQVIEKHTLNSKQLEKPDHPSVQLQLENCTNAMLKKEVAEKTQELRKLTGEELHGLDMEDLIKLEKTLEGGLGRVQKTKDERYMEEISTLKRKEAQLMEANAQLKQMVNIAVGQTHVIERGQSSESITNNCSFADPTQDYDSSDTSLKLGLPFPN